MSTGVKWKPPLADEALRILASIPKATLFVVAMQLAAQVAGEHDELDASHARAVAIEWQKQYFAGNVPQALPPWLRALI